MNNLLSSFIPIPSIGQKSLELASISEIYSDLTIFSNNNAAEITGDNSTSNTNTEILWNNTIRHEKIIMRN